MAITEITLTKRPDANPVLYCVRGDNNSAILRMHVDRHDGGIDLAGYAWAVYVRNAANGEDVCRLENVVIGDALISLDWRIGGIATDAVGYTVFELEGIGADNAVWQSGSRMLKVYNDVNAQPSDDVAEWTEWQKMLAQAAAAVQTVNGVKPDNAGNVELEKIPTGVAGQYMGFDEQGKALPMDLPELPDMGVYYVNVTKDETTGSFVSDRTREEIAEAHDAGRNVVCRIDWGNSSIGTLVPLADVIRDTYPGGVVLVNSVMFCGAPTGAFVSVSIGNGKTARVERYGLALQLDSAPVVFPTLRDNIGKLFYVAENGTLAPLQLGEGLEIVDGKLQIGVVSSIMFADGLDSTMHRLSVEDSKLTLTDMENNTQTEAAICGCTVCGNVNCGEE